MNAGLRKHLKQLPWFLLYSYPDRLAKYETTKKINKSLPDDQKIKQNAYRSPSPMNELCEYINEWERKKIIWNTSALNTSALILNDNYNTSDKRIRKLVKHEINEFAMAFKKLLNSNIDDMSGSIDQLILSTKKKIKSIFYENSIMYAFTYDEDIIANYVISVSYSNNATNKTFCWMAYGETILKNLKANSPKSKSTYITEVPYSSYNTYEYLGKYYLMQEGSLE